MTIGAYVTSFLQQIQSWLSHAQITVPDETLLPSPELLHQLEQALWQLPCPSTYTAAVQSRLTKDLAAWQQNPNAPNSLVLLSCPVEPMGAIMTQSLTELSQPDIHWLNPLQQWRRSTNPAALRPQLQQALGAVLTPSSPSHSSQASSDSSVPPVIVIPCLEDCLLRCIHGWESIEYLQNLIVQNPSQFWLIGCNSWAWAFLDRVCQISSYLGNVQALPDIDGASLQQWLTPVLSDSALSIGDEAAEAMGYWNLLAKVANGTSRIAAHLWLRGLRIPRRDPDVAESTGEGHPLELLQHTTPIVPRLPELTALDRYLIHSLLLHGSMTRSQLVLTLGEREGKIRARMQTLQREGVIWQAQHCFRVHPAYYPILKLDLRNNNFLIGEN